ncbi:MAG: DUF5681 domain-containing protein [Geminicoccaceae bacterium]
MPKRPTPSAAWKPGQSGNPDGKKLTAALRRVLSDLADPKTDNETKNFHKVAEALVKKAITGDTTAIEMCFNRLDGKVPNVNVEIPVKAAEEMTRDELLAFIAGTIADRGSEEDSALSRAEPAGTA